MVNPDMQEWTVCHVNSFHMSSSATVNADFLMEFEPNKHSGAAFRDVFTKKFTKCTHLFLKQHHVNAVVQTF